jgi:hypothetical protein
MMDSTVDLNELFQEHNTQLADESFSRNIFQVYKDVKLHIPLENVVGLYNEMSSSIGEWNERGLHFINQGLELTRIAKNKKNTHFHFSAMVAYRVQELCKDIPCSIPHWCPEATVLNITNGTHDRTFLFNWATVQPDTVPTNMRQYLSNKLRGELQDRTLSQQPQNSAMGDQLSALKSSINTVPEHTVSAPQSPQAKTSTAMTVKNTVNLVSPAKRTKEIQASAIRNDNVEHGLFVANKYRWLVKNAAVRAIEFALTIEELSSILKSQICYFSGEELVHYEHSREEMTANGEEHPDNYLTVDRINSDKGYVSGNVVVCAKNINAMKDRMSSEQFEQVIAAKKMFGKAGFTPEMMHMLFSTMNSASDEKNDLLSV